MIFNRILLLLTAICALLTMSHAASSPLSGLISARLIYGTTFSQDSPAHITVAFYDNSGAQINPAIIDISTVQVRSSANGLALYNLAISAFGIQFDARFLFAGSQTLSISLNGASVTVPVFVNTTVIATARYIYGNEFNTSTQYIVTLAFYNSNGQINPRVIDIKSASIESIPAGLTVSGISDSAYGIQFQASFPAPGFYTIIVRVNGYTVVTNATVLPGVVAPSKNCKGEVQLLERLSAGSNWTAGNTNYKIFDVAVKNLGACGITSASFPYRFAGAATITNSWNLKLDSAQGYGSVILYGPVLAGSIYNGAGFIVANYTTFSSLNSASAVMCSTC